MKKKLKGLIGLMSVCAVGAISGAYALTRDPASATGDQGKFDQAINLYWGSAQTSLDLEPCSSLTANVPEYRYFAVAPQSTKSVAGTVTIGFALTINDGDYHIKDLTVKVYRSDDEINAGNIAAVKAVQANLKATLDEEHNTANDTFTVVASNTTINTTTKYYAVEVVYTGETVVSGKTLGGTLVISQSFEA